MSDTHKYLSNKINKSSYAENEEVILKRWQQQNIFKKTLEKDSPKGEFVFFDGPPTANGRPGIHHLEPRAFKDAIPRYKTMQGYHVRRKGGWDTHGLPVELQVEKELGLTSKKEIEDYGIAQFNEKCRESVWTYLNEWTDFSKRVGYWVDLDNPYVTYHANYVESVWNIVKQIDNKKLLYKDYKVLPWCPRCGTALSSHELAQGYKDVKDISITAKFELEDEPGTFLLAWTTTPWTLPGNVGLAVGEDIEYVKIKQSILSEESEKYVLTKELFDNAWGAKDYVVLETLKGKNLVGKTYKPLFPYLKDLAEKNNTAGMENAYKVYAADFVTTEDGTGIVHTAVMYGQEDFELGTKVGLPKIHLVNQDGKFVEGTDFLTGRFVKEETDNKPTIDIDIIKYLQEHNTFFAKEKYEHSYPHCWRCSTPLVYYARDSWYINMQSVKENLIKENESIHWEPAYIRDGRFGEWLRDVKDWAISRERYWGTPLPVWEAEDGERIVIGSYNELRTLAKEPFGKIVFLRHGESEKNVKKLMDSSDDRYPLTEKGIQAAEKAAEQLATENIDVIFSSPVRRARETAEIVAKKLGLEVQIIEGLREVNSGEWDNMTHEERAIREDSQMYADMSYDDYYNAKRGKTGESWREHGERIAKTLENIISENKDKTVLCVGHQPLIAYGDKFLRDLSPEDTGKVYESERAHYHAYPVVHYVNLKTLREFDPHRPFIDDIVLEKNGKEFHRVKEVMDVWFDSGAMPFAQDHYPFENKERLEGSTDHDRAGFPADFISEAIDQTRGWFYTLHAVGNLLDKGKAYKNVICLGHILDEQGQKMSKSKGNVVNPWDMIEKYGVDTLRYWMYSVNQPGEPKNFDEKTVLETQRKVFGLLENVVNFYELYNTDEKIKNEIHAMTPDNSSHVLDVWVLALLRKLTNDVTKNLDDYKLLEPTRAIRDFIADFSQWYIRRSRDRFKGDDMSDKKFAMATTRYILLTLSKLLAPFAPFMAERVYASAGGDRDSVHLETWPEAPESHNDNKTIQTMELVRRLVSEGLLLRDKARIKVRQVLNSFTVPEKLDAEYLQIIADEMNVKTVKVGAKVDLDINVTPELQREGEARELIRFIQSLRKAATLEPEQKINLIIQTDNENQQFIDNFSEDVKKNAGVANIVYEDNNGEELKVGSKVFKITINI